MSDTLTPGSPTESQNGVAVRSPVSAPPPTDQEQFDADVQRNGKIVLQVIGGVTIFAAFVMSGVALIISTGKSDSRAAPVAPAVAAAPAAPATPGKIGVSVKEFSVNPSATQAPAGRVTFNVKNTGTIPHEMVVLQTDKPAGSLLKGARADETGNLGETGDLAPGASKTVSVKLKAGHYALICNLPGHYSAGQHIDFTVK
ncbi:MAG: hypothetical protein QOC77_891 [Thermoleophilaceae bacterium]|jgi:uncharacterized cupredoxin-like copper-binding protein|nr:hypothetical protein [Thermoleophilaceae bacterium]MEA2469530.1 hypothetical protein [Thermoleophilaceae bacterium]